MGGHFTQQQLIRAARYAAYGAAVIVILVVAAALAVPLFLDTPAVERELQAKLSQLVQGEIGWENLSIRLLPSPRGSLGKFTVEVPGVVSVRADRVDAHLRLLPLLQGRTEIAAVTLEKPVVRVRIALRSGPERKENEETPADPVARYRSALAAIRELLPEALLEIEGGELELELEAMAARVRGLRLRVQARADGNRPLETDFDVRAAEAEIARGTERVRLPGVAIGGKARAGDEEIAVDVASAQLGVEGLPGPIRLAGGSVRVTGDSVRVERADLAMLDARALVSATIDYSKRVRISGTVSESSIGEGALAWAWKAGAAPPNVKLKTPIRVTVQRAAWGPGQPLELAATAAFDSGPGVSVDLAWTPGALDIRRATIKDANSDAALSLRLEKGLAQGRFSGSLQSATIGAALKETKLPSGGASGDLRFRVDPAHPGQGTATGRLKAGSVDLAWLLGRPVVVERVEAEADGRKLAIRQASVNWAEQRFALAGTLTRAADGAPVIDAQLSSPGVVVDALLPPKDSKRSEPSAKKDADDPLWKQWPLPVRGQIALRAGFVQYGERKAEPVVATLTLEEQKARLELKEAKLCGISFPLSAAGTREGLDIAVRLVAQKQQLERTARCLTERGLLITGEFDLDADLHTRGRPRELLPNLDGTVNAQSRDGRVMKFALLGNILSLSNVAGALEHRGPKLDEKGFPYRSLTARGRFEKGAFLLDESGFSSDALGLAATGRISLVDYQSRLTVLVAPFARVDRLVRGVPLVGYIFGGVLTSIPVGVSGDIRDPLVVPLGPAAVTSELKGVFERTITLPAKLVPPTGGNSGAAAPPP